MTLEEFQSLPKTFGKAKVTYHAGHKTPKQLSGNWMKISPTHLFNTREKVKLHFTKIDEIEY